MLFSKVFQDDGPECCEKLLFFKIPLEPGEREKKNSGEQWRLSERSETERVQPRPEFFKQANGPEGRVLWGCPFFRPFFGQAKKGQEWIIVSALDRLHP